MRAPQSSRPLEEQISIARQNQSDARNAGRVAVTVHYSAEFRRIDITMSSGVLVGIPVELIPELDGPKCRLSLAGERLDR